MTVLAFRPKKPGGALSTSPEASERLRGNFKAAAEAGLDVGDFWIKKQLEAKGLAWTRENFIKQKWRGDLSIDVDDEPFKPEYEIPENLQRCWGQGQRVSSGDCC